MPKLIFIFFCSFLFKAFTQVARETEPKVPEEFGYDYNVYLKNNTKHLLKRLIQINKDHVFTGKFESPKYPNRIVFFDGPEQVGYKVTLPNFLPEINTTDVNITLFPKMIFIKVNNSGLFTFNKFFSHYSPRSLLGIVKGRDYEMHIDLFDQVKNTTEFESDVKDVYNDGYTHRFEVTVLIKKSNIDYKYKNFTLNKTFPVRVGVIAGMGGRTRIEDKKKLPFLRSVYKDANDVNYEVFRRVRDKDFIKW